QGSVVLKRHSALRQLDSVTWDKYEAQLYRVFPELKTDYDNTHTFKPPWEPENGYLRLVRAQSPNLLAKFDKMTSEVAERQRRGYDLEKLLASLFDLHGVPMKKPFKRNKGAEQIDGAFELDGVY